MPYLFLVFVQEAEAVKTFRIYLCSFKLVRALENIHPEEFLFIKAEGSSNQNIKGEFRSIRANKVSHQEQEERGEKTAIFISMCKYFLLGGVK